jgi:hypothetical protein
MSNNLTNGSASSGLKTRVQLEDLYLNDNFNGQKNFDTVPRTGSSGRGGHSTGNGYSTVKKGTGGPTQAAPNISRQLVEVRI